VRRGELYLVKKQGARDPRRKHVFPAELHQALLQALDLDDF
jgi:hypothetical protein